MTETDVTNLPSDPSPNYFPGIHLPTEKPFSLLGGRDSAHYCHVVPRRQFFYIEDFDRRLKTIRWYV